MGGALSLEEISEILKQCGFRDIEILISEVSDSYANKWGHGPGIKDFIASGDILAYK